MINIYSLNHNKNKNKSDITVKPSYSFVSFRIKEQNKNYFTKSKKKYLRLQAK